MAEPNDEPCRYYRGTSIDNMSRRILKCPKCGSTDIVPETGFVTGYKYHCEDCEYVGALILEVDEKEEDEKEDSGKKEDDS